MQEIDIQDLLKKHLDGTISPSEKELLENWYLQWKVEPQPVTVEKMESIAANIYARLPKPNKTVQLWKRISVAAAAALVILSAALFFYKNQTKENKQTATFANDIAPGRSGATLTLANGKKIRLSNAANGELASQAGVTITKSANGQLRYEFKPAAAAKTDLGTINTLSTAKGETYQLRLPDGSMVWLNAASSLTYAANLNERGKRRVRLDGEGYFEIAKDKAHPFIVESKGLEVEVLGTHFNVQAYAEETNAKTTLLEGSVKVNSNTILKPGYQALLTNAAIKVQKVEAEDAIAWKNGVFIFDDEPLSSIMKKIERWYNVEVIYSENVNQNELYGGSVSRYDKISAVLKTLELTKNIHFKIEGRRLIVMR